MRAQGSFDITEDLTVTGTAFCNTLNSTSIVTDTGSYSTSLTVSGLPVVVSGLTVAETDGSPIVYNVNKLVVSTGTLTDNGNGQITIITSGGGGAGGFWQQVGKTTLSSNSDSISVSSLDAYDLLRIILYLEVEDVDTNQNLKMTFNDDTSAVYGSRVGLNGGGQSGGTGTTAMDIFGTFVIATGALTDGGFHAVLEVYNKATKSKFVTGTFGRVFEIHQLFGNGPDKAGYIAGHWANQTDRITKITLTSSRSSGSPPPNIRSGSQMLILGANIS
jgi:hypothetical protein